MERLKGKTAMVVGAGSIGPGWGNGKATATLLARQGASVFLVDVNQDAVDETKRIIESDGGTCATHICNMMDSAQVAEMVQACITRFKKLDILVNNVGIGDYKGIADTDDDGQPDNSLALSFNNGTSIIELPNTLFDDDAPIELVDLGNGVVWSQADLLDRVRVKLAVSVRFA